MNKSLIPLAERRERLIAQAAAQRLALVQNIAPLRTPLARVDQGLAALRVIRRNPAWIAVGFILIATLRPLRAVKLLERGWLAWQMVRGLTGRKR